MRRRISGMTGDGAASPGVSSGTVCVASGAMDVSAGRSVASGSETASSVLEEEGPSEAPGAKVGSASLDDGGVAITLLQANVTMRIVSAAARWKMVRGE